MSRLRKLFFSWKEMQVTDTGKPNYVALSYDVDASRHLRELMLVLTVLRGLVNVPIHVNSAFRSPEVNSAVGGAIDSYHLHGRAADITCSKLPELFELCMKLYDSGVLIQCILYPERNFIHIAI